MKIIVQHQTTEMSLMDISDRVFGATLNMPLVHQVVNSFIARGHTGTKKQKSRAEVSGGNSKPWPQKGTGRARAASIRNPLFRTGGVTFAARGILATMPKINKKMYRLALRNVLSELLRQERLIFIQELVMASHKTKDFPYTSGLFVVANDELNVNLILASRNLIGVQVTSRIDPYILLQHAKIYLTCKAVRHIESHLA